MCRALKVLCVAEDRGAVSALKRATVSAEWELTPGATSEEEALAQLESERPHVLVAFGDFEALVRKARASFPGIRIVVDRDVPEATMVVRSADEVRAGVKGLPPPGGPVR
jgi:hypothetical protein